MTVATKDYGDRDFDYPEVELEIIMPLLVKLK